jgi:hypothetical protein
LWQNKGEREEFVMTAVEATLNKDGRVTFAKTIRVTKPCRVIVTFLDSPAPPISETTLLSEAALAEDWNRPEEDVAWAHLQPERSFFYLFPSPIFLGISSALQLSLRMRDTETLFCARSLAIRIPILSHCLWARTTFNPARCTTSVLCGQASYSQPMPLYSPQHPAF